MPVPAAAAAVERDAAVRFAGCSWSSATTHAAAAVGES